MNGLTLPKTRVKSTGMKVILWGILAWISVDILAKLGVIDFTGFSSNIITVTAVLFIWSEAAAMQIIQGKKKLDAISIFGVVVGALALAGVIATSIGQPVQFLITSQAFVSMALAFYVIIEIFR